jgi:hypothetical protein
MASQQGCALATANYLAIAELPMDSQQLTLSLGWCEVEMMSFILLV